MSTLLSTFGTSDWDSGCRQRRVQGLEAACRVVNLWWLKNDSHWLYTDMYIYIYIYVCVCVSVCMCIYIYIHMNDYICTYMAILNSIVPLFQVDPVPPRWPFFVLPSPPVAEQAMAVTNSAWPLLRPHHRWWLVSDIISKGP